MNGDEQSEVLMLVSGILHLGNIIFSESNNDAAMVHLDDSKTNHNIKTINWINDLITS